MRSDALRRAVHLTLQESDEFLRKTLSKAALPHGEKLVTVSVVVRSDLPNSMICGSKIRRSGINSTVSLMGISANCQGLLRKRRLVMKRTLTDSLGRLGLVYFAQSCTIYVTFLVFQATLR